MSNNRKINDALSATELADCSAHFNHVSNSIMQCVNNFLQKMTELTPPDGEPSSVLDAAQNLQQIKELAHAAPQIINTMQEQNNIAAIAQIQQQFALLQKAQAILGQCTKKERRTIESGDDRISAAFIRLPDDFRAKLQATVDTFLNNIKLANTIMTAADKENLKELQKLLRPFLKMQLDIKISAGPNLHKEKQEQKKDDSEPKPPSGCCTIS